MTSHLSSFSDASGAISQRFGGGGGEELHVVTSDDVAKGRFSIFQVTFNFEIDANTRVCVNLNPKP